MNFIAGFFLLFVLRLAFRWGSRTLDQSLSRPSVPRLYADAEEGSTAPLAPEAARRLKSAPRVRIALFSGEDETASHVARVLSRALCRDLALLPDLHVRADRAWRERAPASPESALQKWEPGTWLFGGTLTLSGEGLSARMWHARGLEHVTLPLITAGDLQTLVCELRTAIMQALACTSLPTHPEGWAAGYPKSLSEAVELGRILEHTARPVAPWEPRLGLEAMALDLMLRGTKSALLADLLGDGRVRELLDLYRADPYAADLCLRIHSVLSASQDLRRHAAQFTRRALELSPTHPQAHLLAAMTSSDPRSAQIHFEIAHSLDPHDPSVTSAYAKWLLEHTQDYEAVVAIAKNGVHTAPLDPRNFECLLGAYEGMNDKSRAKEAGAVLQRLLTPPLAPTTWACLSYDPQIRDELERHAYQGQARVEERLLALEAEA